MKHYSKLEIRTHDLPNPKNYYSKCFPSVGLVTEWAKVKCPFHDDKTPSMSINLKHGGFICRGECNTSGNLIQFHMKLHKLNFVNACKALGVWSYDK